MSGVRVRIGAWVGAVGVLVAGVAVAACAGPAAARMADRGDYAGLRNALAVRQKAGDLSNDEAASIAKSVVAAELRSAPPPDAAARVRDVWACARDVDSALAARMAVHDDGGAQAALARLDARNLGPGDVRRFSADEDPRWRAVGARSLVGDEDRAARLRALVDPSPLVRRQAARAAREVGDARDLGVLAEVARVDPEPIVRTEAVRALASLPGVDVATTLRDLWTGGDDGLREDIAIAWASAAVWGTGGRDALRILVASGSGPGVIEGAAAVLRRPDAGVEMEGIAVGVLARAIEGGSRRAKLQALAEAPLDARRLGALLAAVTQAAADEDLEVRVSALSRLVQAKEASSDVALAQLEALAQPQSPVGERARFALAAAGDRRVQLWLEQDMVGERPESRIFAANALATLGVAARAAPLLADSDASVRLRAACTIVGGARFRR
jgi:hypothetical protein